MTFPAILLKKYWMEKEKTFANLLILKFLCRLNGDEKA